MLYKNSPEDVKLILIDPKKVEFAIYEGIPHLMLPSVITEPDKAASALNWAVNEMERRYRVFQQVKLRDIGKRSHKLLNKIKRMRKYGLERSGESDSFNIIYKHYLSS